MSLTKRQVNNLNKIIQMAQQVLATAEANAAKGTQGQGGGGGIRRRRSSAEAAKMRADILAKRAKGVPATTLAEKYGVSTAYIYMIKE